MIKRIFPLGLSFFIGLLLFGSLGHLISTVEIAHATDHYYVDALNGDDNAGDGSAEFPWQTISYALSQVIGPDIEIHVAPGLYDQALGENFPIVMEPAAKLIGSGSENTIIAGISTQPVVHFPGTGFYTETTVLRGFKIMNGSNGVMVNGRLDTASTPVIEENWITANTNGIRNYADSSQRVSAIIRNNRITNNSSRGIDLYTGYNGSRLSTIISGNEITYNNAQGIYCYSQGSGSSGNSGNSHCNPTISDNLIAYNGSSGFHCNTYYAGECRTLMDSNQFVANSSWGISRQHAGTYLITNRPTFVNNIFVGNHNGIQLRSGDNPQFINNTIAYNGQYGIQNGTPTIINSIIWGHSDDLNVAVEYVSYSNVGDGEYGGINNNLSIDPQFSNSNGYDLHLLGTSPLIDAGNSTAEGLPTTDIDGDGRVLETAVDMGADETTSTYSIAITKTAAPSTTVTIDDVISYTITLVNSGEASAAGILVTDTLPNYVTWDGTLNASSGTATIENGVLNWIGWLPAHNPLTIDFNMRVNPLTAVDTSISNMAAVRVPTGIITESAPVILTVGPGVYWHDSSLTVSHDQALAGHPLTYTIQLVNRGNTVATGVTVTDTLDPAASFVSADHGGVLNNDAIMWSGLSVDVGEVVTLTAVVTTTTPITPNYIASNQAAIQGGGKIFQPAAVSTQLHNPAKANFFATDTLGPAPRWVAFYNLSQYATSYLWDYGDGTTGTATGNHVHRYLNSGIYTVTLTAFNNVSQDTLTRTSLVTIYDLPVASFTATPRVGTTPLLVTFTNTSFAGESFIWDYGDGTTSSVSSPTHTHLYASEGLYSVSLTAVNAYDQDTTVRSNYIGVYDAPIADFSGAPTEGIAPLTVLFDNNSTNATMNQWDFGDGHTSVASNPGNIYTQAGVYTVTLTASNPGGSDTITRSAYITVHEPPDPNFIGSPRIGITPLTVSFTNLSERADSFLWNYGDNATSNNGSYIHNHVYDAPGSYTVQLTATNPYGSNSLTRNYYIRVYDPPISDFSASPTHGGEPLSVQFTNQSQNATNYLWSFGDGSSSNAISPYHTYQDSGVYTVTLRAANPAASAYFTRTHYIVVEELPEPSFTAAPRTGYLSLTTTFTNTSIYADSYIWQYGDGTSSTTAQPVHSHTYDAPGLYNVALTAVNDFGSRIHTETNYIIVYDTPQANFTANPTVGPAPLTTTFFNQSQDASSYEWSFGDGSSSTNANPTHTYANAGVYTVSLTAANQYASHTLTRTQYITSYDLPVAAMQAMPRIGEAPLSVTFTNQSQYADALFWDYGDGSTQSTTDIQHTHTYTTPGVYTVTLTATNVNGSETISQAHYIAVMPPSGQHAYYVDALYGSNDSGNGTINYPWQTISNALSQVDETGVTIYVATGLYDTILGETFPIIMEPGIQLIGGDQTAAIINGPGAGYVIHFTNATAYPDTTLIQGFKISGGSAGVRVDGAATTDQVPQIMNNWITGNTDGVQTYVNGSWRYVYATIGQNLISENGRYGIYNDADSGNQTGSAHTKPTIIDNVISNNGSDGIYCDAYGFSGRDRGSCYAQIIGNQIIENGGSGVRASAGYAGLNNIVLHDNTIAHNQGWGVKRTEGPTEYWTVTRPKLYNNLIHNNSLGGFNVHKEDEVVLVNNTIVNNGPYGIKRENSGERSGYAHVINSIVWGHNDNLNNIIVDWVSHSDLGDGDYSGTNYNISQDPQFVNPQQEDFHIRAGSPVVDSGDSSREDLPYFDFEGDPRIWLMDVDMGADELFEGPLLDMGITVTPDLVIAGQQITYTLAVTSQSHTPISITLRNMLPAQVTPSGEITRSLTFSTYQQVRTEQITTTVNENYAGLLVNTLEADFHSSLVGTEVITTPTFVPITGLAASSDSPTTVGQSTTFTATIATGSPISYTWDFGDGSSGYGAISSHVYAVPGVYTATVTASNLVNNQTVSIPVTVKTIEYQLYLPTILRE